MENRLNELPNMCKTSFYCQEATSSNISSLESGSIIPTHPPVTQSGANIASTQSGFSREMSPHALGSRVMKSSTSECMFSETGVRERSQSFPGFEGTMNHHHIPVEFLSNQTLAARQTYTDSEPGINVLLYGSQASDIKPSVQFGSEDQTGAQPPGGLSTIHPPSLPIATASSFGPNQGSFSYKSAPHSFTSQETNAILSEPFTEQVKSETMHSTICSRSSFSNFETDSFSSASSSPSPLYIAPSSDFEIESSKGLDPSDGMEKLYTKQDYLNIVPTRKTHRGGRTMAAREEGITDEEWERIRRRRERNKMAAQRCREKKRIAASKLVQENQQLESNNTSLRYEVRKLQKYKLQLEGVLAHHTCKLACRNEFHNVSPKPSHDILSSTCPAPSYFESKPDQFETERNPKQGGVRSSGTFGPSSAWQTPNKNKSEDGTYQTQENFGYSADIKMPNVYCLETSEESKQPPSLAGRSCQSVIPPCGSRSQPFVLSSRHLFKASAASHKQTANPTSPFVSCSNVETDMSTLTQSQDFSASNQSAIPYENYSALSGVSGAISSANQSLFQSNICLGDNNMEPNALPQSDLDDIQSFITTQNTADTKP